MSYFYPIEIFCLTYNKSNNSVYCINYCYRYRVSHQTKIIKSKNEGCLKTYTT